MSSAMSTEHSENTCVVCFKNVEIYSIGQCDHPVCYECSTRMRVICVRNECPICRQDMPKVIFTRRVQPFKDIANYPYLVESRYKIYFENTNVKNLYEKLLEHRCPKCEDRVFPNFTKLSGHMSRQHELFYCELCVSNLKIFTFERRVYTRQDLAYHRRKGDVDDRSHKGHPNCNFCDCRFMDNDELYRHLRRDHYYCHFCDADGRQIFYSCYRDLRDHFGKEHFLCEEGHCVNEEFTSVFLTEIDLKAHKASTHMAGLTKAATKQARTLELEFTLAPRVRERGERGHRSGGGDHQNVDRTSHQQGEEELGAVGGMDPRQGRNPQLNLNDFPSLGAEAPAAPPGPMMQRSSGRQGFTIRTVSSRGPPSINDTDYPALGPKSDQQGHSKTVRVSVNSKSQPAVSIHVNRVGRPTGPPQPQPQPQQSATSLKQAAKRQGRPTSSAFDTDYYPPLTPLSAYQGTAASEWVATSSKTERGKTQPQSKVQVVSAAAVANFSAPSPLPSQFDFAVPTQPARPVFRDNDFPSLGPSKQPSSAQASQPPKWKAASTVNIPMSTNWSNPTPSTAQSSDNETSGGNFGAVGGVAAKLKKKKKKGGKGEVNKLANGTETAPSTSPVPTDTPSKRNHQSDNQVTSNSKGSKEKSGNSAKNAKSKAVTSNGEHSPKPKQERKRSELEIGDLHLSEPTQSQTDRVQAEAEPPPTDRLLSLIRGDNPARKAKPGPPGYEHVAVQPPPGFEHPVTPSVPGPPPGFEVNMKSVPLSNGLTFTSSSGESYPIYPLLNVQYTQPPDFQSRNAELKLRVSEALRHSDAGNGKSDFQEMSILYRQGYVPVQVYYDYCKVSIGEKSFVEIFPEMVSLLPDISQQQELYAVYMSTDGAVRSNGGKPCLEVCGHCGQVLLSSDVDAHTTSHRLNSQFPALPVETHAPSLSGAWSRK